MSATNLAQPRGKRVITTVALVGQKWDNGTTPRRCLRTVNPGGLTVRYEGATGL